MAKTRGVNGHFAVRPYHCWQEDWYAWNMGVDLLFIVDLIARFLTAYYDDTAGRMVFQPTSICRNYARGLLIPDLIASVPLTMVGVVCLSSSRFSFPFSFGEPFGLIPCATCLIF